MRLVTVAVVAGMLLVTGCSSVAESSVLTPAQAVLLLADNPEAVLIDVRTPAEVGEGFLANALMLDAQDPSFVARAQMLDPNVTYVLYCRSGNRSAAAISVLAELGFTDLHDAGAYIDLVKAGVPTG